MKYKIIFLLFLSVSLSASGATDSTDTIVLTGATVLGEIYPVFLKSKKTSKGEFVVKSDVVAPGFYHFIDPLSQSNGAFFLQKGDSILISRNEKDSSLHIEWTDKKLKAVFDAYEQAKIGSYYAWDGLDFVTPNRFETTYLNSSRNYLKRKDIIREFASTLPAEKVNWLYTLADINRLYSLLLPYNPCSPISEKLSKEADESYQMEVSGLIQTVNKLTPAESTVFSYCLSAILINYSRYVTRNTTKNAFEARYNASGMFNAEMKDRYLTLVMLDKINNKEINTGFLNKYLDECKNEIFREKVTAALSFVDKVSNDSLLLNTMLEDSDGVSYSWKEILAGSPGQVVYVDLWASWCAGCKLNIPKIMAMQEKYPDMRVLFISKDKGTREWAKSMKSWGISSLGRHLRLDPDTELAKVISQPSIPRGMVINKDGKVVTIDADEPNSEKLNTLIEGLL